MSVLEELHRKFLSSPILKATLANNLKHLNIATQRHPHEINEREPGSGRTALMIACRQGFAPGVRELLARGANTKLLSRDHKNALHYAVMSGNMECCKALLQQKHSPEEQVLCKDNDGKTPLDHCSPRHSDIANLLQCYYPKQDNNNSVYIPAPEPSSTPEISTISMRTNGMAPTPAQASVRSAHLGRDSPRMDAPPSQLVSTSPNNVYYPPNPDPGLYPPRPPQTTPPAHPPPLAPPSTRFPGIPRYPTYPPSPLQPSMNQHMPPWNGYGNGYAPQSSGEPKGSSASGAGAASGPPASTLSAYNPVQSFTSHTAYPPVSSGASHAAPFPPVPSGANHTPYPPISSGTSPMVPSVAQVQEQIQRLSMNNSDNPLYGTSMSQACAPSAPPLPSQNLQQYQQHLYYQLYRQQWEHYERQMEQKRLQDMEAEERKKAEVAQHEKRQKEQSETESLESMLGRKYTRAELEQATDYFSPMNKLGGGGFGAVYKGFLDGTPVAIKVMDESPEAMQGIKEFAQEMVILSRMRHPHIVLLIGACSERGMRALVYELAEGGSLDDHMFRRKANSIPLSWEDRIRITTEVAAALLFLHSSQPPITHMDIKPANVLLTRNLEVKLGDVGLARIMKRPPGMTAAMCDTSAVEASALVGTLTYVDPEYMRTGQFSTRSDVYALGMVMLQLLTGVASGAVVNIVGCARGHQAQFFEVLDPVIKRAAPPQAAVNDMMAYAELAMRCLEFKRSDRPDMRSGILPVLTQLRYKASMYTSCRPRENSLQSAVPPTISESDGQSVVVPAVFICPITQEILRCPVVAADGYTYEERAIKEWIQRSPTSPLTNLPLAHTCLTPNLNLRSAIGEWLQQIG